MADRKPSAREILIPRRFNTSSLMADAANKLGYSYFMDSIGNIKYIDNTSTILWVEDTEYTIMDYPTIPRDD